MFSDSQVECTGFPAVLETERDGSEGSSQTTEITTINRETQTGLKLDTSNQTNILFSLEKPPPYDSGRLSAFLNRIYPDLLEELNKCEKFRTSFKYDESEDVSVKELEQIESVCFQNKAVSCLSWNCTGTCLAISFSETVHETSCMHESQIHVYSTYKKNFATSPPKYLLNTNSCVSCIAFHPSQKEILIAGQLNGHIILYDLERYDPILHSGLTVDDGPGHKSDISGITWLESDAGFFFITVGKDGGIITWQFDVVSKNLKIKDRFYISDSHKSYKKFDLAEITSISAWKDKKNEFVIAGGNNILVLSIKTENFLNAEFTAKSFRQLSPIDMEYEPHSGIITCVNCSNFPFFATCGTDSQIRVYRTNQRWPIHIMYADMILLGIEWVDDNSKIISCWGLSSNIQFYKTDAEEKLDAYSIKLNDDDSQITAAKLNKHRKGVIALGTQTGCTSIWMIPKFR